MIALLILVLVSVFITLSPLGLAAADALFSGGRMFDETSSGVYLWFLYVSIPLGVSVLIVGLIVLAIRYLVHRKKTDTSSA